MEKKTFTLLGLALAAMAASVTGVQYAIMALVGALRPAWSAQPWFSLALVSVFYFVGAPVFWLITRGLPTQPAEEKAPLSAPLCAGLYCFSMLLVYLGSWLGLAVTTVLNQLFGGSTLNPVGDLIAGNNLWLVILVAGVLSPIMEELVFRKLLLERLRPFGDRVAVLYCGLAFGLYHMNFAQFFYAFMLGCLLAYIMLRTNNLLYPIGLHIAVNLTGSVLMPLLLGDLVTGDLTDPAALLTPQVFIALALVTLFFVGGLIFALTQRRRLTLRPARWRFSVPVNARLMLLNPGALLYIFGCLFVFFLSAAV